MWSPTVSSDELYHHGILGMKWGVRRYQNKDGTLTAAGRSRYDLGEKKAERKEKPKKKVKGHTENFKERIKNILNKKCSEINASYSKTGKNLLTSIINSVEITSTQKISKRYKNRTMQESQQSYNPRTGKMEDYKKRYKDRTMQETPQSYNPRTGKMEYYKKRKHENIIY